MKPQEIKQNVFELIGSDWCLIGACKDQHYNMMCASWGGFGVLWNKEVATIYIRPQRYTKEFVDDSEYFTLSFFEEEYREILSIMGSKSGRDIDKENYAGITGIIKEGVVYFKEAKLTIKCKKIYQDTLKPECFLDDSIEHNYPKKDYHDMYIGEILEVIKQ